MKKIIVCVIAGAIALTSLWGCGVKSPDQTTVPESSTGVDAGSTAGEKSPDGNVNVYKMNIGSAVSSTNPSTIALQSFKEAVESRTNGGIKVQIFPDSALGGETDLVEQVRNGDTEACVQMGAANFSSINPEVNFALLPFLFTNIDNARKAWDGELGEKYASELVEPMGYKVLSIWESGYRHMTNNTRPIAEPEDVKGIKFRTNENEMKVAMYDALDASVVIMPFSDVYTGLQNGTINGQENPLANIYTSSLQDVQKYLSLTGHMYDAAPFVCNANWFNSLPQEYQNILVEEAAKAKEIDLKENDEEKYLNMLKDAGMEVNNVNSEAFQNVMKPIWQDFANKYSDGQSWIDLATSFNK
ncbi:tripartite ATP-independent transporter DctP family solute receptor [Moryella indoligenes]|uniref:Tripartite ATP-independent transporter DctP family solute receptor n=1 Tax=Moryella indoligenes TaxID=371674 RepID=A0AAE4ALY7_9FIRM|nr:DctP family TRAP transporter solute-binding subunit [Moryella indoligenes]MDQ0153087.1 tripartite ATP-independent transporter DctP family solute receptor [Moryella indoligenes]